MNWKNIATNLADYKGGNMSIKYKCNDCGNEFYFDKGNWVPIFCPICGKASISIINDIDYTEYGLSNYPIDIKDRLYNTADNPLYRDSVGGEEMGECIS